VFLCIFNAPLSVYRTFCSRDTCYATLFATGLCASRATPIMYISEFFQCSLPNSTGHRPIALIHCILTSPLVTEAYAGITIQRLFCTTLINPPNLTSSRTTYGLARLCPSKSLPPLITLIHKYPPHFTNFHPKSYFPIIKCFMMIVCLCHCVCCEEGG